MGRKRHASTEGVAAVDPQPAEKVTKTTEVATLKSVIAAAERRYLQIFNMIPPETFFSPAERDELHTIIATTLKSQQKRGIKKHELSHNLNKHPTQYWLDIMSKRAASRGQGSGGKPGAEQTTVGGLHEKLRDKLALLRGKRENKAGQVAGRKAKPVKVSKKKKPVQLSAPRQPGTAPLPAAAPQDATSNLVFSKFNYETTEDDREKTEFSGKNYKELLAKVTSRERKLDSLEPAAAAKLKEKVAWSRTLEHAAGTKVKDDATALRRAMKRQRSQKKRSSVAWKERVQGVADKQAKVQEKRKVNKHAKSEEKLKKKIKKSINKGRMLPGF